MERIDCSNAINFAKEKQRMCNEGCSVCEMQDLDIPCIRIDSITEDYVKIVQEWSDAHPQMTRKDKFIKMCEENGFGQILEEHLGGNGECKRKCPSCAYAYCDECEKYWNENVEE